MEIPKFNLIQTEKLASTPYLSLNKVDYVRTDGNNISYTVASRNLDYSIGNGTCNAVTLFVLNKTMNKMIATTEFRYTVNRTTTSTPAGLIDEGESPFIAAVRELEEETGYFQVLKYAELPATYSSVGMTDELVKPIVLVVDETHQKEQNLDENELIDFSWISKEEAKQLAFNDTVGLTARAQLAYLLFSANGFDDLEYIQLSQTK